MRRGLAAGLISAFVVLVGSAPALAAAPTPPFSQCPAVGRDTSCALLIYVDSSGQVGVAGDPSQGPFDGVEDTLIGVQNNSSTPISSIPLSATSGKPLFGFDGDGLCNQLAFGNGEPVGCPFGPTGYEGPGVAFANISPDTTSGTVTFSPAIAPGGSAYFSLEEALATQPPFDISPGPPNGGLTVKSNFADSANEPAVAVNPTNPANIVVAYNDFRSATDVRCGYEYTTNGGQSWSAPHDLAVPPSTNGGGGDPSLTFTQNGTLYFSCLSEGDATDSAVQLSLYAATLPNGSPTLSNGAPKFGPSRLLVQGSSRSTQPDMEFLTSSPTNNDVYMCYTFYAPAGTSSSGVRVAKLGLQTTGSGPVPAIINRASASAGTHQLNPVGCTVSVQPSGRVWAAWWDGPAPAGATDFDQQRAFAAHSDNGALSFTGVTTLGGKLGELWDSSKPADTFIPQRRVYIQASPAAGDGRLLALWEDAAPGVDRVRQTVFSGTSWGAVTTVATDATQPTVAWGADGTVLYGYYTNPKLDATQLSYGLARSSGPATGPLSFLLAPLGPSSETTGLGPSTWPRFADYNGIAEANGVGYAAWTDNSGGHQTVAFGHTG